MSKRIKVMSVFGTRPEAIKMAPLVLELQKHPELESVVCITAQHREMLDSVMDCFGIRADYDLNIMQQGQDLTAITTRVLERMRDVLSEVQPDIVLVHGDTTTTFAGALAAFYAKIPVGHVEAGLRTYDRWSPFPEEMNRALVGRIATLHFAPTANNARNLEREAVAAYRLALLHRTTRSGPQHHRPQLPGHLGDHGGDVYRLLLLPGKEMAEILCEKNGLILCR